MSTYTQFGYTYAAPASQLLVSQGSASAGSNGCCEGTRALMTDPVTGQTVCSCQYDRLAIGTYSRLGSGLGATGGVYGSTYPSSEQNPYPSIGVDSSAFYPPFGSGYGMKEGGSGDVSMYGTGLGASPAGYYPYDATFAAYGYGPGYDLAARRKNATRESTATLKAWLNEHKKNPYPTKGEKIMLAIITKMTLTQVSTWFANARRRLKKENKMTWEPRNKTDDDDAKLSDDDDDEKEPGDKDDDDIKKDDKETDSSCMAETKVEEGTAQTELKSCEGGAVPKTITAALSPAPPILHGSPFSVPKGEKGDCSVSLQSSKPKIWSLADTAACKTPPPAGVVAAGVAGGWLAGGTTFPLPPTIPPSQPQYSRFSQLMSGVNASQYMSGYSSESVGTDTPPQTPPNASKTSSGNFLGSINGGYGSNLSSCGQTLSSCSRGPSNQAINVDATVHQRYSATVSLSNNQGNPNSVVMQSNTFSPVYKGNQPTSQNSASQQSAMVSQQQQLQCQQNQQSATVTAAYVS